MAYKLLLAGLAWLVIGQAHAQVDYSFTALSGTYAPLTGATVGVLAPANPGGKPLLDECFVNNVPIGFAFQYNGLNYTTLHLNVNGYASLGAPFSGSPTDPGFAANELRGGGGQRGVTRPVLAPFWDDLALTTATDLTYKTEGVAPGRVFVVQWQNMAWQGGNAALSFQLRLYETSNIVEFSYRPEAATTGAGRSASVGISAEKLTTLLDDELATYLSLNGVGASPLASSLLETETINQVPAAGQVYRFTPLACAGPGGVVVRQYNTGEATIGWTPRQGSAGYQVGINNVEVPPATWQTTTQSIFVFTRLLVNQTYYIYVRDQCGSESRMVRLKTTSLATVPYSESFEGAMDNALPRAMRRQELSNPFADAFWQTSSVAGAATGQKAAVNAAPFVNGRTWLFTPGLSLVAGTAYKVSLKTATVGGAQALEIRWGTQVGDLAMTNSLLNLNNLTSSTFRDTSGTFQAPSTGVYYIGVLFKSTINEGLLLLDDLRVGVDPNPPVFTCLNNPLLPNYGAGSTDQVRARNTILATNTISAGAVILLQAGDAVDLLPGFEASPGTDVIVQTGPCNE